MDLRKLIQEYLKGNQVMQIASVVDNNPWIATVYFVADSNLNLYWISRESRRHSQELSKNSHAAVTIVKQHTYGEKVRGLQAEGNVKRLKNEEAEQGFFIYKSIFWVVEARANAIAGDHDSAFCYKFTPDRYVLLDEVNFPESPSQELKL